MENVPQVLKFVTMSVFIKPLHEVNKLFPVSMPKYVKNHVGEIYWYYRFSQLLWHNFHTEIILSKCYVKFSNP